MTESERFAGIVLSALADKARVKYTGASDEGTLVVVSERETGINFSIDIVSHAEEEDEE